MESRCKKHDLAHNFTRVGHKSTLTVFLKANGDSKVAPVEFPLNSVELENLCSIWQAFLVCRV